MVKDFSQFLPKTAVQTRPTGAANVLEKLGWKPFFSHQINPQDHGDLAPVRVAEVHRNGLHVLGNGIDMLIPPGLDATVGDWILYNAVQASQSVVLERNSLIERRAPGKERRRQLIAANVDTLFIVSSCNKDFNIARLERYVSLAFEAEIAPVIVLTKTDLCEDPTPYTDAATTISNRVSVVSLNALGTDARSQLLPWCAAGQTVAFVGSSGVGKSTLVNALFAQDLADTAGMREGDSKGRHTTTRRQLHFLPDGCAVLDTPGMRELQLTDVEAGVAEVFDDLTELATQCRFRNCAHDTEPGCAVQAALARGEIDASRMARWNKLAAEERFNSASLADRKADDKTLHKAIRSIQKKNRK